MGRRSVVLCLYRLNVRCLFSFPPVPFSSRCSNVITKAKVVIEKQYAESNFVVTESQITFKTETHHGWLASWGIKKIALCLTRGVRCELSRVSITFRAYLAPHEALVIPPTIELLYPENPRPTRSPDRTGTRFQSSPI